MPVVQKIDSTVYWINPHPLDMTQESLVVGVIYPHDVAVQPQNNCARLSFTGLCFNPTIATENYQFS